MRFEKLSKFESVVVGELLRAAADGPFFPEWEFQTLFGLERAEVRSIASEWPLPKHSPDDVVQAVNNAMNLMLSYPHRKHGLWADWISADQQFVEDLLRRLRKRPQNENSFDRMM